MSVRNQLLRLSSAACGIVYSVCWHYLGSWCGKYKLLKSVCLRGKCHFNFIALLLNTVKHNAGGLFLFLISNIESIYAVACVRLQKNTKTKHDKQAEHAHTTHSDHPGKLHSQRVNQVTKCVSPHCVRARLGRNAAGRHSPHVTTGSVSSWACDRMGTSDTVQNKTAEQLGTEAVVQQDKTKCRCATQG